MAACGMGTDYPVEVAGEEEVFPMVDGDVDARLGREPQNPRYTCGDVDAAVGVEGNVGAACGREYRFHFANRIKC